MRKLRYVVAATLTVALVALATGAGAAPAKKKFAGTIKIGANSEMSGFDQAFGTSQVDGIRLAVKDINAAGGVKVGGKSYRLKAVVVDNRSDPTGVVQAAQELANEGVLASSAPNNNFDAGYEIQKQAGILTFGGTPLLALKLITKPEDHPTLFSVIPFAPLLFPRWLPQLKALFPDVARIGVLIEDEPLAGPLVGSIENAAKDLGMEVVATERFKPGTTDFSTELTRIRESDPDIVFTGRVPIHNVPASQQAAQLDVAPIIWTFTGIPSDMGDLSQFDGKTLVFSQFAPTLGKGATIPALKAGEKKLNKELDEVGLPEITIALYNFVQLLAQGITEAGTVDDANAVAKAMEGLTYKGPFGSSRIDPEHYQDHPTSQIVYVDGKTTVYVYKTITDVDPSEEIVVKSKK